MEKYAPCNINSLKFVEIVYMAYKHRGFCTCAICICGITDMIDSSITLLSLTWGIWFSLITTLELQTLWTLPLTHRFVLLISRSLHCNYQNPSALIKTMHFLQHTQKKVKLQLNITHLIIHISSTKYYSKVSDLNFRKKVS